MLSIFYSSFSTVEFWWLISSDEDVVMNSTMRSLSSGSLSDEFVRMIERSTTVIRFCSKSEICCIELLRSLCQSKKKISEKAKATKDDELSKNSISENLNSRERLRICEMKNFTDSWVAASSEDAEFDEFFATFFSRLTIAEFSLLSTFSTSISAERFFEIDWLLFRVYACLKRARWSRKRKIRIRSKISSSIRWSEEVKTLRYVSNRISRDEISCSADINDSFCLEFSEFVNEFDISMNFLDFFDVDFSNLEIKSEFRCDQSKVETSERSLENDWSSLFIQRL